MRIEDIPVRKILDISNKFGERKFDLSICVWVASSMGGQDYYHDTDLVSGWYEVYCKL